MSSTAAPTRAATASDTSPALAEHPLERLARRLGLGGDFYVDVVRRLLAAGDLAADARVLVVCGGPHDRDALLACGLRDVTISNLDVRMHGDEFAPYAWSFQDAERLDLPDASFDVVVAHNGLHHCRSPHRALCEMYRVARRGVLVFEPYDGLLSRLAVRTGLGQEYEVAAVFDNGLTFGGVQNSAVPNFVYRWTAAEVRKVVGSVAPEARHRFRFFHAVRLPMGRLRVARGPLLPLAFAALLPALALLRVVAPRLANNFAFWIGKPELPRDLQPWLCMRDGKPEPDVRWFAARYHK